MAKEFVCMRPFLGRRKGMRMLHKKEQPFIDVVLLAFVLVLGLLVSLMPGCTVKQPNTMTIDERLEPYRYFIKDTLYRGEGVEVFVGEGYYKLDNQQRIDFAQNLSWSYYPTKVVVKDVRTNYVLMSVSEDRHIQLIWQQEYNKGDE